jgi:hypothetical protein
MAANARTNFFDFPPGSHRAAWRFDIVNSVCDLVQLLLDF